MDINSNKNKIEILETTLRDGVQGNSINYSLQDKLQIHNLSVELGIDLIEAGAPQSNPLDAQLFTMLHTVNTVAFGSTMHKDSTVETDTTINTLIKVNATTITLFGKASLKQVEQVLKVNSIRNLEMIEQSIIALVKAGKRVIFDAEHFFEGYTNNKDYAVRAITTAYMAGADTIVLCDTKGIALPNEVAVIVADICKRLPKVKVGIHCHNDLGLAVANTITAVQAGARHIQGTLLGFGERCGNACLSSIIPTLQYRLGYDLIGENIVRLTETCLSLCAITNIPLDDNLPYVGGNAFSHKAGTHIDGVIKDANSYEHIDPSTVGNERKLLVSILSGKANINNKIVNMTGNTSVNIDLLLNAVKEKETNGYTYDGAEASFYILCKSILNDFVPYFKLKGYKTISDETGNNSAIIKLSAKNSDLMACGEGVGPVHALDLAMRNALSSIYPELNKVSLTDYKVRVIDSEGATGAKVRVIITSSDGIKHWSTVGVSADIIQASYNAMSDSFNYYLDTNHKTIN